MTVHHGSCHCGAVALELRDKPVEAAECNCSLCRRVAGLWHYCPRDRLSVTGELEGYVQGDRTLTTWRCKDCGNVSHWTALDPAYERVGVNLRLFDPSLWQELPRRLVDGASF
jgi:hypothetical protein